MTKLNSRKERASGTLLATRPTAVARCWQLAARPISSVGSSRRQCTRTCPLRAEQLRIPSCGQLAPFSAAFLGWLVLREKVDGHTWAAMTTAVVGVVIMGSTWYSSSVVGISAACCIPLMLGIYTVLLRDSQRRDPRAQVFFTGVIGLVIGLVASAVTGGFALPIQDIFLALISGGILLGVGLPIFNAAGRHVPAARTSLLLLSEIVVAPIWGWLVVNEVPAGKTVAGGAVILLALIWVTTHPKALLVSQPR